MTTVAVIPTIPGREALCARAVESFERYGVQTSVIANSPSCGGGWRAGLDCTAVTAATFVLLAADDVELLAPIPDIAYTRATEGAVVSPAIYWPDGSIQGIGGYACDYPDGADAANCIFPFALVSTLEAFWPWPETNHYCDVWITGQALQDGRGPIVTRDFRLSHSIVSGDEPGAWETYLAWQDR